MTQTENNRAETVTGSFYDQIYQTVRLEPFFIVILNNRCQSIIINIFTIFILKQIIIFLVKQFLQPQATLQAGFR